MRKTCLDTVFELAKQDPRVVFVGSDLGHGTLDEFRRTLSESFFMEGISEANIIGMAAGLAMEGSIPYVNTMATFLTRRAYEQVAMDVCHANLPVRLLGNGGGLVYAPLGPTHEAIEDIALMRALPNMTIVAPADALEMKKFMQVSVDYPGPIFVRIAKGYDPIVTDSATDFEIGKAISVQTGTEALLVTTGISLGICLDAAKALAARQIDVGVLHLPTVKPLDVESLISHIESVSVVVSVEEHSIIGGLGSAVAELIAEASFDVPKRFRRIGIPDVFPNQYGSQASQLAHFGITAPRVALVVEQLATRRRKSPQSEPAQSRRGSKWENSRTSLHPYIRGQHGTA